MLRKILFLLVFGFAASVVIGQEISYLCTGNTKQLTVACTDDGTGTGPFTYKWTSPTGVVTNSNVVSVSGVDVSNGVWTWECGRSGCSNIGTHEIIVEPNPTITIIANNSCVNTTQVISSNGVPSGYTFVWDFGAGAVPATSVTPTTSVLWSSLGSKTITLTVTKNFDGTQCDATCEFVATKVITIGAGSITGSSTCN